MTVPGNQTTVSPELIQVERTFLRFTIPQRWEHFVLFLSITALLVTGLPQKYQNTSWSQWLISTPERLKLLQDIHHIFALLLSALVLYHLGRGIFLMTRRKLADDFFPNWQDVRDVVRMIQYLLFIKKEKPKYGKYNFEQKITYWFIFFAVGIMVSSGFVLWFPIEITYVLPGGVIPAAFLAHSNEAIVLAVFVIIWHFYHVHIERLNLSIFTGRINETELREHHPKELERLLDYQEAHDVKDQGGSQ